MLTKQQQCVSTGMDQGFHNYIVYSGIIDRYLDMKVFPQGEGPVNTLGGLKGKNQLIRMNLTAWGIARGISPNIYLHNWNGDISPVVHQYDRFQ